MIEESENLLRGGRKWIGDLPDNGNAGRVRQQLMQRNPLPGGGTPRDVGAEVILHVQFALFLHKQDGQRGKLFDD